MKIQLDLTNHCIQTEVKRRHEAAISRYFKGRKDREAIEAELVLLEKALSSFDFARLRSRWPVLAGGDDRPVFLVDGDSGLPCLRFDDQAIRPPADES
ncbi:hypothetical protein DSCW_32300 [Desulfosarcina widdelii]|uniref:Uncharacterized protein n=1 Tax=Desulfosarcina widdelii TaxID=947919 RepID=A0A5K7Z7H8_9BACT|nr:hypothetical protein [Desulfosarcina widdelii]BBO75813.1 hypothetical protein DSCW_32300 [Desulfosarcina widdelii]